MKSQTDALEKCLDDESCTAAQKKEKLDKVQKTLTDANAEKPTAAEKKEVQVDANMQVKRPSACTSATNCEFICEEFVDVGGVNDQSLDLTKAASGTRRLSTGKIVYSSTGGYDADDDKNSVGGAAEEFTTDAAFPEEITGNGGVWSVSLMAAVSALFMAYMNSF